MECLHLNANTILLSGDNVGSTYHNVNAVFFLFSPPNTPPPPPRDFIGHFSLFELVSLACVL